MMENKKLNPQSGSNKLYIRYRIYVQKSERADKNYPIRLLESINKLHYNILNDELLWNRDYESEGIKERVFFPDNLKHINPQYFGMIRVISIYFDCYAKWQKMMIPGTIDMINTFKLMGYDQDVRLALHYIGKLINNLECMKLNMRKSPGSSSFFYKSLHNLQLTFETLLEKTYKWRGLTNKVDSVEYYIKHYDLLDYRKFKGDSKANIKNAYSRIDKFQNNRIIR